MVATPFVATSFFPCTVVVLTVCTLPPTTRVTVTMVGSVDRLVTTKANSELLVPWPDAVPALKPAVVKPLSITVVQ
jgi:hypothetical protein